MSFDARERVIEGITILDLHGRLIVGEPSTALRSQIREFAERGQTNMILNLEDVPSIDSTGLGVLVAGHSEVSNSGGALKLLHLTKRHVDLLVITKLSTVFETFDDESVAIDSFFPDRQPHSFDVLEFVQSQNEDPDPVSKKGTESPREKDSAT